MTALRFEMDDSCARRILGTVPPLTSTAADEVRRIATLITSGDLPAFSIARTDSDLPLLETLVTRARSHFSDVVFIGMGGSTMCGMALISGSGRDGYLQAPRLHFLNNPDPTTLEALLAQLPLATTQIVSISKSGGTIETLYMTLAFVRAFQQAGLNPAHHLLGVTEDRPSALSTLLHELGAPRLPHDPKIGGRYAALSVVGVLPALYAGMDARALRQGAAQVLERFLENPLESAPLRSAQVSVQAAALGRSTEVWMGYSNRLKGLGPWWAQLWAESLGKHGKGTFPVAAVGAIDQHSLLQLFADGADKALYTLILPTYAGPSFAETPAHAKALGMPELGGVTGGALLAAQAEGTRASLEHFGRPLRVLRTGPVTEATLGALIQHGHLTTVMAGVLWGVNAFDQPAVEDSKRRTLAALAQGTTSWTAA